MNIQTITQYDRSGAAVLTLSPVEIQTPGPVRLRHALTLPDTATDDEVHAELESLGHAAACDGCRHGGSDGRGHFACSPYHPAWDVAEELGLADAVLGRHGWTWSLG